MCTICIFVYLLFNTRSTEYYEIYLLFLQHYPDKLHLNDSRSEITDYKPYQELKVLLEY